MKQVLIGVGSGLVAGSLALTLLFLGPLSPSASSEPTPTTMALPDATLSAAPTPTESEAPIEPEVIECSVAQLENSEGILSLQAEVIDTETDQVLFERSSDVAARAASVMKLFTAAAALEQLGPDYFVTTRVYMDAVDPSKIYLVGAGDVTLSRTEATKQSVYRNAPKLQTLAKKVLSVFGEDQILEIVLDSSLYGERPASIRASGTNEDSPMATCHRFQPSRSMVIEKIQLPKTLQGPRIRCLRLEAGFRNHWAMRH